MMFRTEVNLTALDKVLTALCRQDPELVAKLYHACDDAMKAGYDSGKHEAEENIEGRLDAAFDRGYGAGCLSDDEWEEGYLAGVEDARVRPGAADDVVQYILSRRAKHALNGEYDASLVTDTGDETHP